MVRSRLGLCDWWSWVGWNSGGQEPAVGQESAGTVMVKKNLGSTEVVGGEVKGEERMEMRRRGKVSGKGWGV